MSDDSTTGEPDAAQPQQPQEPAEPWRPPAVKPGVPEVTQDIAPTQPPAFDAAAAGLAPLAAGTSAGWYHTRVGHDLRYWDGTAWTARTAPGEAPKAPFGAKYKRRFGVVLLVVAGLNALSSLGNLGKRSLLSAMNVPTSASAAVSVLVLVGAVLGIVGGAALWTLVAAAFPGRQTDPVAPRKAFVRGALPWGVLAAIVAAPLVTYSFVHRTTFEVATITSTKDGCHAFLTTAEASVSSGNSNADLAAAMQALYDAAAEHDPMLAADVKPLITHQTAAAESQATQAIVGRCLNDGELTQQEVADWAARLKAIVAKPSG